MRPVLTLGALAAIGVGIIYALLSSDSGSAPVDPSTVRPLVDLKTPREGGEGDVLLVTDVDRFGTPSGSETAQGGVVGSRQEAVSSASPASSLVEGAQHDGALGGDPRLVSFRSKPLAGAEVPALSNTTLWLFAQDEGALLDEQRWFGAAGADVLLAPGDYVAALGDSKGDILGACESFSVANQSLTVLLSTAFTFDLDVRLLDVNSLEPIGGVALELDRVGLSSNWAGRSLSATSDAEGFTKVPAVSPGRWRIRLTHEGHVSLDQETELPWEASQEERVRREGVLSLGDVHLKPFTPIRFELVGAESWTDLSAFKIAHTHLGEPVAFDREGQALLHLGYYAEPVYLNSGTRTIGWRSST